MSDSEPTTEAASDGVADGQAFVRDVVSGRLNGEIVNPETGEHLEAVFKDPTDEELARLEALEEQAQSDGEDAVKADRDFGNVLAEDFLLEATGPDGQAYDLEDLDPSELGAAWKQSITVGFLKAVGATNEAIKEAQDFFEERMSGNR